MDRLTTHPLIKEKSFKVMLVIGLICIAASVGVFLVMAAHYDSCLPINSCYGEGGNFESLCEEGGTRYCCGGYGGNCYSCHGYISNCRKEGSSYFNCSKLYSAQKYIGVTALLVLFTMALMLRNHEKKLAKKEIIEP